MSTKEIFSIIVNDIHSSIIATNDESNKPVTCVIDIMDSDENGLYFLTAKGKRFYNRLIDNKYLSLTALKGESTMSSLSINIRAKVKEIGDSKIDYLFEKNPYMNDIYPTEESKKALSVFYIYDGSGELFDLSKRPIYRENFTFSSKEEYTYQYVINDNCISCKLCLSSCPQDCIIKTDISYKINQNNCLHCGNCLKMCQSNAIENLQIKIEN